MNILGPISQTEEEVTFLIVATYRYSKLPTANLTSEATATHTNTFFLHHYTLHCTIADNRLFLTGSGPHFVSKVFELSCKPLGVKHMETTVSNPQTKDKSRITTNGMSRAYGDSSPSTRVSVIYLFNSSPMCLIPILDDPLWFSRLVSCGDNINL